MKKGKLQNLPGYYDTRRFKRPGFDDNDRSDSDARNLERTSVYSSAKRPSTVVRSGFLSKKLVKFMDTFFQEGTNSYSANTDHVVWILELVNLIYLIFLATMTPEDLKEQDSMTTIGRVAILGNKRDSHVFQEDPNFYYFDNSVNVAWISELP
ncbi:unnamed protein product [Caenorhabditis nigoni]